MLVCGKMIGVTHADHTPPRVPARACRESAFIGIFIKRNAQEAHEARARAREAREHVARILPAGLGSERSLNNGSPHKVPQSPP